MQKVRSIFDNLILEGEHEVVEGHEGRANQQKVLCVRGG